MEGNPRGKLPFGKKKDSELGFRTHLKGKKKSPSRQGGALSGERNEVPHGPPLRFSYRGLPSERGE